MWGTGGPAGRPPSAGREYPDELWLNSAARPCLCSFHGPRLGLMTTATLVLVLVVVVALAFDFTNGFHDTGNAMATSIATGALRPKIAVGLSAVLNLVGAFLSVEVALTVTNAVINIQDSKGAPKADLLADGGYALLLIILAGLVGGIVWNLLTWLLGPAVVLVARPLRRPHRRGHRRPRPERGEVDRRRHQAGRRHRQGDPAGLRVPGHRRSRGRPRDVADLPGGGERRRAVHQPGLPVGPDRQRVARLAGPRHQRRPEDDGRHHPRSHRGRPVDRHRRQSRPG